MHNKLHCPLVGVAIYELTRHQDQRGWLSELWREDEYSLGMMVMPPAMCYVSLTRSGVTRGPHEHKIQWDRFIFLDGHFSLQLWDNRKHVGGETWPYRKRWCLGVGAKYPVLAEIPPGVVHAYTNHGEHDSLVINMPNRLYAGYKKEQPVDEIRWEDSEEFVPLRAGPLVGEIASEGTDDTPERPASGGEGAAAT